MIINCNGVQYLFSTNIDVYFDFSTLKNCHGNKNISISVGLGNFFRYPRNQAVDFSLIIGVAWIFGCRNRFTESYRAEMFGECCLIINNNTNMIYY